MSDLLAMVDLQGLATLVDRVARLRLKLEKIDRGRPAIEAGKDDGYNEACVTRLAAAGKLTALLDFLEDSESLAPELHQLLNALLDLENGRLPAWLRPAPKKGQPPKLAAEAALHGRYAAIMDWLMSEGDMTKQQAAEYVVTHGGLRRRIEARTRAKKAAHAWETVANWRDRVTGSYDPSRAAEHAGFDAMYEIINGREYKGADGPVETEARNLLRALKNLS